MQLPYETEKALKLLNLGQIEENINKSLLLKELMDYLFEDNNENGKIIFDFEKDYEFYYYDFYKLGIDLEKDNLSWWKFNSLLTGIFNEKHSNINQIIEYRTYETPSKDGKKEQRDYDRNMKKLKRKYSLKDEKNTNDGINDLWNYLSYQERSENG